MCEVEIMFTLEDITRECKRKDDEYWREYFQRIADKGLPTYPDILAAYFEAQK